MTLSNEQENCHLIESLKSYITGIEKLLNPAAEGAEIKRVVSMTDCQFPDDFRNLYSMHNGEGDLVFGVMAGFSWMSLQRVMGTWKGLQDSAYDIISDKPDAVKEGEYRRGWIPFAEDGGGSFRNLLYMQMKLQVSMYSSSCLD